MIERDYTSLNKSRAWYVDGACNKKNPNDFYKLLTFKRHVSKFVPNRTSLQIIIIQVKQLLQIFKTMEKSEFRVLIKHCFLMGKKTAQAKQRLDKCYSHSTLSERTV